jgi:hypothetical protein
MPKPLTRLYAIDIERRPWTPTREDPSLLEKVIAQDPQGAALTRLVRLAPGAELPEREDGLWREAYLLEGSCRVGEEFHPAGTYTCIAPHTPSGQRWTAEGATWIELWDPHEAAFAKAPARLYPVDIERMAWATPAGSPDGVREKVLTRGPSGSATRLLEVDPGVDNGVFNHDHSEEVLMLSGSYKMGDEFHPCGTYTCKGPGVDHGPFWTTEGYSCLEVRNYA